MICCSPRRLMQWNAAIGAIARCKATSIGCERKRRSVCALRWTCGVKPTPKGANKPSPHSIMHALDKPGSFTTVSHFSVTSCFYRLSTGGATEATSLEKAFEYHVLKSYTGYVRPRNPTRAIRK